MEDFDSVSSKNLDSFEDEIAKKTLWMCGASLGTMLTDEFKWCKDVQREDYIPIPYPKQKFEPIEWAHCLATLDVCKLNHKTKFYDEEGCDIIPIKMVTILNTDLVDEIPLAKEIFHQEEVCVEDLTLAKSANDEFCKDVDSDDDFIVLESKLEKVRMLLKRQKEIEVFVTSQN